MEDWLHGLFGCFGNLGVCILTCFFPYYTFGKISHELGHDCCLCACLYCVPLLGQLLQLRLRMKLREKRRIDGSCLSDCVVISFCTCCSLVQEAREIHADLDTSDWMEGVAMERA